MYSDLMGVTEEVAEAALWGVNAIPEGEREDIYIYGGHAACAVWGCGRMSWAGRSRRGRRKGRPEGRRREEEREEEEEESEGQREATEEDAGRNELTS
jgi:hypothetical protein